MVTSAALAIAKRVMPRMKKPTGLELHVCKALVDLEASAAEDLKHEMKSLKIVSAREMTSEYRKVVVVTVPYPQLKSFHKVQTRLVRELEKKLSGRHVMFVAQRRIMPKASKTSRVKVHRPRNRTLTAVHEAVLNDLVYPTDIVGRRLRVRTDGSRTHIVYLDPKDRNSVEGKLRSFALAYKKLTGRDASFEFPQHGKY